MIQDVKSLLEVFEATETSEMRAEYLRWVRLVAEERWHDQGLSELPWWVDADDQEEVANPLRQRGAETFDQKRATEDRIHIELDELLDMFEKITGMPIVDLRSSKRRLSLPEGRVDLAAIAVGRFGHTVCDLAERLKKNPGTVSRWLTKTDRRSQENPEYLRYLDALDADITKFAGLKS